MPHTILRLSFALLSLLPTLAPDASARSLRPTEEIRFLPGLASVKGRGEETLLLEGRTVLPPHDSMARYFFIKALRFAFGYSMSSEEAATFEVRGNFFLATKAPGVDVEIFLSDRRKIYVERTGTNGYFNAEVPLNIKLLQEGTHPFTLTANDGRSFEGKFLAVGEEGLSVISDIDDTIKITDVKLKGELLRNTFLRPFRSVAGMAELYRELASKGASFHYVSASPAQLAPFLENFLTAEGFPENYSLHLRPIDIDPLDYYDYPKLRELFGGSGKAKIGRIENILKLFPRRQFALVGDSSEQDPEVYAELLSQYGDRIKAVWIRDLSGATEESPRYKKLYAGENQTKLKVFEDPARLKSL
jgi:phosphatidate phosphatase APP1